MKRLGMLLVVLSLSMFTLGCAEGKKKDTTPVTPPAPAAGETPAPDAGTAPAPMTPDTGAEDK